MNPGRVFYAVCAAVIGFALGYALPIYARLSRAYYDPIARHWWWGQNTAPIPIGYVGQIIWAILCAAIGAGLTLVLARKPPSPRGYTLGTAWALTALVVIGAYFTWNNWP